MILLRTIILCALALSLPATAHAQMGEGAPHVTATSYTVQSEVLGGERIVTVRLPAGYEEQPDMRFPVIYLLDGGPEQDFDHIAGIVQSRDMNWSFERFILVGVQSTNRRHFFAPPAADPQPYVEALGAEPGGSPTYRRFLREELMPMVNAQFRTDGHDAVIGESLAALFIVETLLEDPTLFDDYMAISPSMWWEQMKYGREAARMLAAHPNDGMQRRLYLTVANEGVWHREGTERLVDALRAGAPANLLWTFVPVEDSETHGSIFHPMALDAFRTLYGTAEREFPARPLIGGTFDRELTAEEEVLVEQECTREESLRTTPGAVEQGRERLQFKCVLLDLGPTPREGNLGD
ncbi:alpha/beta hydrolase [Aurantiacibacter sp. D1-12]|uniref:alpha/beta hydrolase n=1 Tax=Aurantiacibacter sp. D1-12 TaxID=2993658 RepID=UPI00237CB681|nr:alpha/beta hydrolase-fold protein [Aurantiacibacter sp. D1-12]MDE1466673.1 alpha/beta hydrolase-fold protein [Aurantiacibacter sp. D1-12]